MISRTHDNLLGNIHILFTMSDDLFADVQVILARMYAAKFSDLQDLTTRMSANIFTRPGVAGAVLQTPSLLIN